MAGIPDNPIPVSKTSSFQMEFQISITKDGESLLTYRVQIQMRF
jgi:hypothetical protein